jgi:solute carrier family 25 protein 33/36
MPIWNVLSSVTYTDLEVPEYLGVASVAKLIAAVATYPHEVIRTRLREAGSVIYTGVFSGLALIYRQEGIRGLYGGMSAHLFRVVPNAAIMFLAYEQILRFLSAPRT